MVLIWDNSRFASAEKRKRDLLGFFTFIVAEYQKIEGRPLGGIENFLESFIVPKKVQCFSLGLV